MDVSLLGSINRLIPSLRQNISEISQINVKITIVVMAILAILSLAFLTYYQCMRHSFSSSVSLQNSKVNVNWPTQNIDINNPIKKV